MSVPRLAPAVLLAFAATAPNAAAIDVEVPGVCVPRQVAAACVERAGTGVVTHDVTTFAGGGTGPIESACRWYTQPATPGNPRELVLRIDSVAPGARNVAGTCLFRVDGQELTINTWPGGTPGPVTSGETYLTDSGQQVSVVCVPWTTAWYPDGTVTTRKENCGGDD